MSISSSQNTASITKIAPTQDLRARIHPQDGDVSANVTQPRQDDKTDVTLTTLTKKIQNDDSRDIDYARVEAIRTALATGSLRIEPEKIAQAMVQDIFQF
ncbi:MULTISPECIES: flagellar biosynthesis anti-sigma factor FlgM [Enterobacter]|jgi:negative regulator of flagellin synthesis FlgM|uniref:flagellar biosynthesis anti-sigma factor FlgM n=1 Tax=Enterobacter TaxID=547 RepID=UPI0015F5843E|nr:MULTISPECIES: flagellar biosynthesis anti-sigma factor FlgM [Enterobacter]EKS7421877.1 flagellar biosynthesis anti-sigma factor FlgM [Enterobacter ludwigii]MBA7773732.1 flagellar biosynthesis anti-sigma factor FlgM [Enterobacter sp. RHBSTW-00974]MBA7778895.1 flagellar biosynthesis anti-sigma factor FlgM [Enterobacter sp. RHBSTW-00318]MBA7831498.1 flagellar biosynthesis anti-sigma factor FlgM [Enterobacter sp. RHBSTW-00340]MBA8039001.1 flagellar biosynthesis anti-sigma factor FlgM [Enterobac